MMEEIRLPDYSTSHKGFLECINTDTRSRKIRNPNTWTKAREEIRAAQGQGLCTGKVVSFSDARQLPYLQACIKEGLRIHSPVPSKFLSPPPPRPISWLE